MKNTTDSILHENYLQQRILLVDAEEDDKLDGIAREAKRRLDKRLRSSRKSEDGRYYRVQNSIDEFAFH